MDNQTPDVSRQAYLHTHQAAATAPLLQAIISGILGGLVVLTVMTLGQMEDAWVWSLLATVLGTSAVWFGLQLHWLNLTTVATQLEKATGGVVDFNGNGINDATVEQATNPETVRVDHYYHDKDGNLTSGDTEEYDWNLLVKIARAMETGLSFSVGDMVEKSHTLTRREFDTQAPLLLAAKIMEWKNESRKNLGMRPTDKGRETFRKILKRPSPSE